jgi:hypothetical protein
MLTERGLSDLKRTTKYRWAEFQSTLGAVLKKRCGEMTRTATGRTSTGGLDYGRVTEAATGQLLQHAPSTPQSYLSFLPWPQTPGQSLQSPTTIPFLSAQLSCFVCKH